LARGASSAATWKIISFSLEGTGTGGGEGAEETAAAEVFFVLAVLVGLRSQKGSPGFGQATLETSKELEVDEGDDEETEADTAGSSAAWNRSDVGRGAAAAATAGEAAGFAAAAAAAPAAAAGEEEVEVERGSIAADARSPSSSNSLSFLFSASSLSILASADSRLLLSGWADALAESCPREGASRRSSSGGSNNC